MIEGVLYQVEKPTSKGARHRAPNRLRYYTEAYYTKVTTLNLRQGWRHALRLMARYHVLVGVVGLKKISYPPTRTSAMGEIDRRNSR